MQGVAVLEQKYPDRRKALLKRMQEEMAREYGVPRVDQMDVFG